jgi:hypothetical protein
MSSPMSLKSGWAVQINFFGVELQKKVEDTTHEIWNSELNDEVAKLS